MDFDPSFLDAIKGFEGFSPTAQWDYKQWTNGYGTRAGGPDETIDRATAEQRLTDELGKAAGHVDAMGVDNMPPGARNALISLTYNAGPGWIKSGLGDLVRAGDWNGAAQRLQEYDKAGGKVDEGLARRRAAEASWITGPQPNPNGPLGANAIAQARPTPLPLFGQPQPHAAEAAWITGSQPNPNGPLGANAVAQAKPTPPPLFGNWTPSLSTFAGLPAAGEASSQQMAGEGSGGEDYLSQLLAAPTPAPLQPLPPWRPGARVAALMARFPNLRRG